ncbi:RNA polymerase sigma factor [bacterium]|nr:RNA polymerase sigma factor [bacterium]
MQTSSDTILARAAAKGDQASAAQLYHRYADRIFAVCYRVLLDHASAKDGAQEAWVKIFKNLGRYDGGKPFIAWARTIAVRTAIDEFRKHNRRRKRELGDEFVFENVPQQESARRCTDENAFEEKVNACLGLLSDAQRAAFSLRHFEGAAYVEIAQALQCSEGTVKTHIHRAAQVLRKALAPYREVIAHHEESHG